MHTYLKDGRLLCISVSRLGANDAAAQTRLQAMTENFNWTIEDVYAAQTMCPYETVSYGFSKFCDLFTYEEWQGFGYSIDLSFSSTNSFHSPTGVSLCSQPTSSKLISSLASNWYRVPTRGHGTPQEPHLGLFWLPNQRHAGQQHRNLSS